MKRNIVALLMVSTLIFSCSSDKDEEKTDKNALVGTWDATELKIDDNTASDQAKNGRDALNFLTAKDCYVITFTFNEDLSLVAENSVNYLQPSGLDIPCPTEKDMDTGTYTFDGKVLTYVDSNAQTTNVNVSVSGDIMTVDAAGLDIPNFNSSGELIFKKR